MSKRYKHGLSSYRIATGDMGELLPIGLTEVHPGDTFQQSSAVMLRVSPLLAPVMHPVRVKIEHYFVPHRLSFEDFEDFITGGEDGLAAPTWPTMAFTGGGQAAVGSLADYLGVPTGVDATVSAVPIRGYIQIWNEHKRNTLLQTALALSKAAGADSTTSRVLQNANWQNDYYTKASPEPQLGPDVTISLGTTAPVAGDFQGPSVTAVNKIDYTTLGNANTPLVHEAANPAYVTIANTGAAGPGNIGNNIGVDQLDFDVTGQNVYADLSAVTGISIRQLRESTSLQRFLEAQMIHGSRYSELLARWGVRYSDARLQRPEYLGGGTQTIQFSEVLQTGVTTDGSSAGVGNLKGHGIATAKSNRYRKTFEEHGYVYTLLTVLPETMYVQGIPRHMNRRVKTDFFQPEFVHVGQQEILNKEVYAAAASPDGIFGYGPRYEEYRRAVSSVHGEFRSSLDFWHYARLFASEPALNASFVNAVPTKRVNQVTSADVLWIFAHHSLQARRLVPNDSRPGGSL